MNISNPISRNVTGVSFSFYSSDEIRKLSVKQISNPVIFDTLNHPTKDGLYDAALGPTDKNEKCRTCDLDYFKCPGHFGHIDLAVPCYNPVTFKLMYKLLQSTCMFCHHFRMGRVPLYMFIAKLTLIRKGLLIEAIEIDNIFTSKVKSRKAAASASKKKDNSSSMVDDSAMEAKGGEDEDEGEEEEEGAEDSMDLEEAIDRPSTIQDCIERIDAYVANCLENKKKDPSIKTTQITESLRSLERQFLQAMPSTACQMCRGQSPKFRTEGMHKIFQKALTEKQRRAMQSKGIEMTSLYAHLQQKEGDGPNANGQGAKDSFNESIHVSQDIVNDVSTSVAPGKEGEPGAKTRFLTPIEVRDHITKLFTNEAKVLDLLYGSDVHCANDQPERVRISSPSIFFLDAVAVPPNRFRPLSKMNDMVYEHPQNIYLKDILKTNQLIHELYRNVKDEIVADQFSRLINFCIQLQQHVNYFLDSSTAPLVGGKPAPPGIRQVLEKKEGLFRKHMMGKRVNYAARSVISPDCNIETGEIGIPPVFATKLTYPEPVTHFNADILRQAVTNGPTQWPGATHIENEDGTLVNLASFDQAGRTALANQLLTPTVSAFENKGTGKKVYRHLRNGDFLLLNRQPTLHKPSIMAHTARILPGEKTIRMHYANCNTYNADFDGDEMNIHFPQNEVARAEAMMIARTDLQYLVPTDGGVLRGLIQDHVCAGVTMTKRDAFFTREDYIQLVYAALKPDLRRKSGNDGNGHVEEDLVIGANGKVVLLPPAMIKPQMLWTGKQIIATILHNLVYSKKPLNLISKSRVPAKAWGGSAPEEQTVLFMDGQYMTGILDKSQFGASAHGFVHAVYEIYGPKYAGALLGMLSRLFTGYLQRAGFTCRMDDLRLTEQGDKHRRNLIDSNLHIGKEVAVEYTGLKDVQDQIDSDQMDLMLQRKLEAVLRSDEKMAGLDGTMKGKTNSVTSSIISKCIPDHLHKPFPANNMQVMTVSGAKGSAVNVSQISCLLGQQELEGRRVPTMVSGKTLPCFLPFETAAKAGGFITGRFLTGIKPSEYFFHCMAGREGLIDTAVKTSRSGYLQRCLIKHLEGLKVEYDQTVRDHDGSIVQFRYGEDSLDVLKQKALSKFDFCAMNFKALVKRYKPHELEGLVDSEAAEKYLKKQQKKSGTKYQDPVLSKYDPSRFLGSVSDKFSQDLKGYLAKNPSGLIKNQATKKSSKNTWSFSPVAQDKFLTLMNLKYQNSLVDPGEAVGLLAAQSIGEPSTQMTLNTFHFAGFGAKNVTLGIPRLREIVMTASDHIKTPMMKLPLVAGAPKEKANEIAKQMTKLVLSQIIDKVSVSEKYVMSHDGNRTKRIQIKLSLWPQDLYYSEFGVDKDDVSAALELRFVHSLEAYISRLLKNRVRVDVADEEVGVGTNADKFKETQKASSNSSDDGPSSTEKAEKSNSKDDLDDDEDEDAGSDAGGDLDASDAKRSASRTQKATYDAPDDEDEQVIKGMMDNEEEDDMGSDQVPDENGLTQEDRVIQSSKFVSSFRFDKKRGQWCELELSFPADSQKILMISAVEAVAKKCIVKEVKGLTRAYVMANEAENDTSLNIGTEGVNLKGMWDPELHGGIVDVDKITTNDIYAVLKTYGVEAARAAIVNEVAGVFGVYGISVDPRHLGLIADYMTFEGGYKAFNRIGMKSNPSPLAQMSFETTTAFLNIATLTGDKDDVKSPSARLVLGRVVAGGTGAFDVLQPIKV